MILDILNNNSLRNKFEILKDCIKCNADTLLISESNKLFPVAQFLIEGCSTMYRRDRDKNGGFVLIYVREDIASKLVSFKNDDVNIRHFFIEINRGKKKRLLSCSYKPHSNLIETHLIYHKEKFWSLFRKVW